MAATSQETPAAWVSRFLKVLYSPDSVTLNDLTDVQRTLSRVLTVEDRSKPAIEFMKQSGSSVVVDVLQRTRYKRTGQNTENINHIKVKKILIYAILCELTGNNHNLKKTLVDAGIIEEAVFDVQKNADCSTEVMYHDLLPKKHLFVCEMFCLSVVFEIA